MLLSYHRVLKHIRWGDAGDNALVTLAAAFLISSFHLFSTSSEEFFVVKKVSLKDHTFKTVHNVKFKFNFTPIIHINVFAFIFVSLVCSFHLIYNTRSDQTREVLRLESGMIGPTSLLHSRHWALFHHCTLMFS